VWRSKNIASIEPGRCTPQTPCSATNAVSIRTEAEFVYDGTGFGGIGKSVQRSRPGFARRPPSEPVKIPSEYFAPAKAS
jgi:hypothetical protein